MPYEDTIDWTRYWRESEYEDGADACASPSAVPEALIEFLDERGPVDAYADVGCGAGPAVFAVAEQFPSTDVVGYDAAETVLTENRWRARETNLENVRFERSVLPDFDPGRQFDVVSSFFTLCYVADVERALTALYDAVAPGGSLLLTYHNRYAQAHMRDVAAAPEEHIPASSPFDPERFPRRFELVIEGESLLSYERVHEILGTWPRSVWSVVDTERYGAWRYNPLVYVPG